MEKVQSKSPKNAYRFERKFIFEETSPEEIISTVIFENSALFTEIFQERSVNNIYFDDFNFSFYHMNVSGVGERSKYRLRWYSDDFEKIQKATFEIKKKLGEVGDKISYKLPSFDFNLSGKSEREITGAIESQIDDRTLLENLRLLHPALFNSYDRRYFLSEDEKFRITIDYNMKFYNPNLKSFRRTKVAIPEVILELKYATEDDAEARKISQEWSSRLSKNSKYVRGCDLLYWAD